jgi:hypothetical protein
LQRAGDTPLPMQRRKCCIAQSVIVKLVSITYLFTGYRVMEAAMAKIYAKGRLFRNAFEAVVAARSAQADRYVSSALLRFDDKTLHAHGYRREDLERQARGASPFFF